MNPRESLHAAAVFGTILALALGCATTSEDEKHPYVVRAVPGPDGMQRVYQFERNTLWVEVTCETKDDQPTFALELLNRGGGRIQISPAGFRLLYDDRVQQAGVKMFDAKDVRLLQLVLLAGDRKKVMLRPTGIEAQPKKLVVLEVRGIRDDRGDGGFDFDLQATREPEASPENQAVTTPPVTPKPLFGETIKR